ncbi:MAG: hypothetical protein SVR94_18280, partial [Pseudomonadota bacterium]|nr:hypothetical protein [Pseudomonadota bacterium]
SPSMSYSDLRNTLDERLAEQRHRHLWLFLYSNRHAHLELRRRHGPKDLVVQEPDQLIDDTFLLLEKFSPSESWQLLPSSEELAAELYEFCFGITYAFHKRHLADGFIDIRFEEKLAFYDAFIDKLSHDEIAVVSRLHNLTYKYGFLITELWLSLISSEELMEAFIMKNLKIKDLNPIPYFVFNKKGDHPQGIQISTKKYQTEINEPWNMAVFINENDNLSKMKEKISNSWSLPGNQMIGDFNEYKIALYLDRGKCKISSALSALRLQIDQINEYTNGLMVFPESEELTSLERNKAKAKKEMRRGLSSTIDRLRLSEGLISKRWSVEKSNVRRSIGLYLWDQMNIIGPLQRSRKNVVTDLIDKIKSEKPAVLDLYLGNFNKYNSPEQTTKFGDSVSSLETVMREMEADYDLTAYCIRNFEYLTPHDVKKINKT